MKPFEAPATAVAVPIAQPNIDTDQILPARYLQKPRADNFGDYLFRDLRFAQGRRRRDAGFVLNQPAYRDGAHRRRRSATSAAARRASTRSGRCTTTASAP